MSSSSQDTISTGKLVALFSSQNRLNQDVKTHFPKERNFPFRHQQVFGSDEPEDTTRESPVQDPSMSSF